MGSEQFEWREPTEEELREIQERRTKSDLISKIMSDYLLKGFRMLDSYCPECGNAMLDNKKGRVFCVGCDEIDKKPPRSAAAELSKPAADASCSEKRTEKETAPKKPSTKTAEFTLRDAADAVLETMKTATEKLRSAKNPQQSSEYVDLIRSCADALYSLNRANK